MAAFESETHRTFRDVGADDKYLFAGQRAVWEDADGTSARGKTKKLGGERIAKFVAQDGICTVTDPVTGISYPIECPDTFPGLQELPGFRQDEGDSEIEGAVDIEALQNHENQQGAIHAENAEFPPRLGGHGVCDIQIGRADGKEIGDPQQVQA